MVQSSYRSSKYYERVSAGLTTPNQTTEPVHGL